MNTRTTTVRIPTKIIQQIDGLCKKTGNCRNSWINAAIDFVIDSHSDYDFGLDEDEPIPEPKKEHPLVKKANGDDNLHKSHHDKYGNYWTWNKDDQIWTCHMKPENVKVK